MDKHPHQIKVYTLNSSKKKNKNKTKNKPPPDPPSPTWRAASPPGGTALVALTETGRRDAQDEQQTKYNQLDPEEEEDSSVFTDYFQKCMERLMDQHERTRQADDGRIGLFVHSADFFFFLLISFLVTPPGHSVRRTLC